MSLLANKGKCDLTNNPKQAIMQKATLAEMTNGWFIGNFTPTLIATEVVEVAVKEYPAGFREEWHYH
jgi:hypothetical protein